MGQYDLMILPMEEDAVRGWTPGKPTVFLSNPAIKVMPAFSPDGRWIAYVSNEAGGNVLESWVRPFPGPGGRWRVSFGGGGHPRWSAASRELLFFKSPNVMVAPYDVVGDSFRAETRGSGRRRAFGASAFPPRTTFTRMASAWRSWAAGMRARLPRTQSCSSSISSTTCARSRRGSSSASGRAESLLPGSAAHGRFDRVENRDALLFADRRAATCKEQRASVLCSGLHSGSQETEVRLEDALRKILVIRAWLRCPIE